MLKVDGKKFKGNPVGEKGKSSIVSVLFDRLPYKKFIFFINKFPAKICQISNVCLFCISLIALRARYAHL